MQSDGGAEDAKAAPPTKRVRRPNVRLHQPYYESPRRRLLWKDLEGLRKPRTQRALNVSKKIKACNNNLQGLKGLNSENNDDDNYDVVIGSWSNLNKLKRGRDSISKSKNGKRIKSPISDQEFAMSNDGDSEKQEEPEQDGKSDANSGSEDSDQDKSFSNEKQVDGDSNVVGVGAWLEELGLGKYAAVFEVHEVDDEVLPFLTLEDLKDMGIAAVGTRRKMYCSIQKLAVKGIREF